VYAGKTYTKVSTVLLTPSIIYNTQFSISNPRNVESTARTTIQVSAD